MIGLKFLAQIRFNRGGRVTLGEYPSMSEALSAIFRFYMDLSWSELSEIDSFHIQVIQVGEIGDETE